MKRTNFSNIKIRKRRHGYLARTKNTQKKKIIKARILKNRRLYSR